MSKNPLIIELTQYGLTQEQAEHIAKKTIEYQQTLSPVECWSKLTHEILTRQIPFSVHLLLYKTIYPEWEKLPCPAWLPQPDFIKTTHIAHCMEQLNFTHYSDFHQWSWEHYSDFWKFMVEKLNIQFDQPYTAIADLSEGLEKIRWFPNGKINIARNCFQAPAEKTALISLDHNRQLTRMTYGALNKLSNRIAHSLIAQGLYSEDYVAIAMPLTPLCIAIYLGVIKAGMIAVPIVESVAPEEIATRLRITKPKIIFTQTIILRGNKALPLYQKIIEAQAPRAVIIPANDSLTEKLRPDDQTWETFLLDNDSDITVSCDPNAYTTILFSSGTTGDPKAIPWTHTTPIKCASDAFLHHNIQPQDVMAWPTSLGWMMGPWLIFANLINQATIALYTDSPNEKNFGAFVQGAKVTILGLVPSLIKTWRTTACMETFDWNAIKLFSSTGECSNVEDMLYLMSRTNYKPIIEYCGGTEVVCYITGTVVQPAAPAAFTTPALGLHFMLIDANGAPTNNGEIAIIPPSIGLSTTLLNKDHHHVYYANMPQSPNGELLLRRHGDQIEHFSNGFYRAYGRVDDTMNLGGIKVSSAEIERVLLQVPEILETAAIAITPPGGGPSWLVIYVVLKKPIEKEILKTTMQNAIKQHLNPLFKIHDIVLMDNLPRTASNKVMRRVLRDQFK